MPLQKSRIVYLEPVKDDVLSIAGLHLEKVGSQSTRKITDTMIGSIDRLATFPLMRPIHRDPVLSARGYRKLVTTEPFVCIYKVFQDAITIFRIVNGATDYPRLLK